MNKFLALHVSDIFCFQLEKENRPVEDIETGIIRSPGRRWFHGILGTIFLQAFTLTFLAEWGDRSQITTIVLAAREVCISEKTFYIIFFLSNLCAKY